MVERSVRLGRGDEDEEPQQMKSRDQAGGGGSFVSNTSMHGVGAGRGRPWGPW